MFEQMMTQNLYGNKTLIPLFGKKTCTLEPVIVSVGRECYFSLCQTWRWTSRACWLISLRGSRTLSANRWSAKNPGESCAASSQPQGSHFQRHCNLLTTGGVHAVDTLQRVEVNLQVLQQARFWRFPTQPLSDDSPAALVPPQRLLRPSSGNPFVHDRLPDGRSAAQ